MQVVQHTSCCIIIFQPLRQRTSTSILKQVGFLWNKTVVVVVDKLSSTSVDFIRSEMELKKTALIWDLTSSLSMLRAC